MQEQVKRCGGPRALQDCGKEKKAKKAKNSKHEVLVASTIFLFHLVNMQKPAELVAIVGLVMENFLPRRESQDRFVGGMTNTPAILPAARAYGLLMAF